ncbi:aminomethyl-transferring glycine dehydrogenase [Actinomycetaceae bacterium L2_0104]
MSDFVKRHLGAWGADREAMLTFVGVDSPEDLMRRAMPATIASQDAGSGLPAARDEAWVSAELAALASRNAVRISMIGQGYYDTVTPAVIRRGILENPSWYTAYTPYQPEISQGRLEALLNFQTVVSEVTGMDIAGASLLDEATAAAEAVALAVRANRRCNRVAVDEDIFRQTEAVVRGRCDGLGIELVPVDVTGDFDTEDLAGLLVQYPAASGRILPAARYRELARRIHSGGGSLIVIADLLACTILTPPGELGADVVAGTTQRFGVPMNGGGPHAGYIATTKEKERQLPGRLVGVSRDVHGMPALRLALQTREQHIRREKATSNICTAQSLLAIMASMYAVYHGPEGLRAIAETVHSQARELARELSGRGAEVLHESFFDTISLRFPSRAVRAAELLLERNVTIFVADEDTVRISCDELTTDEIRARVVAGLAPLLDDGDEDPPVRLVETDGADEPDRSWNNRNHFGIAPGQRRADEFLTQRSFHEYHSETRMMRYMRRLAAEDYALDRGMIPLGSCTMKLNSAVELTPITYEGFARIHPFAPLQDLAGYQQVVSDLEEWLADITGYEAVSLQPNAGSQGEFAGLLAIRGYHRSRGEAHRDICLIPASAHGTNAASAVMAGFKVVVVKTGQDGAIDGEDLDRALAAHGERIGAIMITYPSTHGTFEPGVSEVAAKVHAVGGQVYIDGANLNALVGFAQPGRFGGDVSHLNLHKTFAIPHGGGGPGVGPVAVKSHLAPFLPGFPGLWERGCPGDGAVSGAPWGSAAILPVTWAYIRLMGREGLRQATAGAVLAANYVAKRLEHRVPVLYRGPGGFVGHECILDVRPLKTSYGITVDDVAKRLIDYGFHAPTMSFPVPGTLMVEPTESEDLREMDRFCDAMEAIVDEAERVGNGEWSAEDNPLRGAPHTAESLLTDAWEHPYSREVAAYPAAAVARSKGRDPEFIRQLIEDKYWPPVGRIDGPWGDRNLQCTCPAPEAYAV